MRVYIIVHGVIQGVGYRSFVKHIADKCGVNGTVKNLPDGSVEIFAEGNDDAINDFVYKIHINKEGGPDVFYLDKKFEGQEGFVEKQVKESFRIEH